MRFLPGKSVQGKSEKAKKEMLEWLVLTSALLGFLIMIYKGR